MSHYFTTPVDPTDPYGRTRTGQIRCAACGSAYFSSLVFQPVKLWRRIAKLRLVCGECKMVTHYAPGALFTEH